MKDKHKAKYLAEDLFKPKKEKFKQVRGKKRLREADILAILENPYEE